MNKKYFFILIPLIAFLFSFERGAGSAFNSRKSVSSVFAGTDLASLQKPVKATNLQTENPRKIKNKVRIKAWDEAGETAVSTTCATEVLFSYHNQQVLARYNNSFRPVQRYAKSLRGPPAVG